MLPQELVESYLLEIVARADSARERCRSLLACDFISVAPKNLAHTISRVCDFLAKAALAIFRGIDWSHQIDADLFMLRTADNLVQQLASHLRYVQGARTERLPWSIVSSLDKLIAQLAPDIQIMLRPKWHYNYSLALTDFRSAYRLALAEFQDYVPDTLIDKDILKDLAHGFRIVAFPSLERENILLHTLLGHEIGHLFTDRFLTQQRQAEFIAAVVPEIEKATDEEMSKSGMSAASVGELFLPQVKKILVARNIELAQRYWIRALEEIISDVIGGALFGPAALFSTLEMAIQQGFDIPPTLSNNFYPPWRMRLREVLRAVDETANPDFFPVREDVFVSNAQERARRVNERYGFIRDLCSKSSDSAAINANPFARVAYEQVLKAIASGSGGLISDVQLPKATTKRRLKIKSLTRLIERLDNDIPPNALETDINDHVSVSFVEIINAAWLHRVSMPTTLNDNDRDNAPVREQRRRANRLTLKALEYANLAGDYRRRVKVTRFEVLERTVRNDSATGVLTAPEIVWWLGKESLQERLIVTPLLNPDESISAGAIDVRLGNQFIIMKRESFPLLDIGEPKLLDVGIERYQERIIRNFVDEFILHPGQLVIGSTLEYVQIPPGLMCYVIGKSTWGRMGLIIATATKVDPGFRGCITLELINGGEVPLVLYPGIPIAQLVLHNAVGNGMYQGAYNCAIGPEFPRFQDSRRVWQYWTRRHHRG